MSETEINKYANGKIYQILNTETDDVYVGSTCMDLHDRMKYHITAQSVKRARKLYKLMKMIGSELFCIVLIENYPCETKDELRRREGHYIRSIGTLNMCIAGRTKQEWKEENKEHISQQGKEYREKAKANIQEYQRSEKVKEWKNAKVECPCGGTYTKCHKAEHFRCAKHRDYEESLTNPDISIQKERKLEETKTNQKEHQAHQQKLYRESNKD